MDIEVVRGATLFAGLDDEATSALMKFMNPRSLRRGTVLFHEGDAGDELYIVSSGKLKIGRESSDGRENLLSVVGPGEIIGELSLFDPGPRSTSVTAVSQSELLSLKHDDLTTWLNERPQAAMNLLKALAQRLRRTNETVGDLVFSDVPAASPRRCSTWPPASRSQLPTVCSSLTTSPRKSLLSSSVLPVRP